MSHSVSRALYSLLAVLATLAVLGVIMVYSSSYIYAKESFGNSAYFFHKQLLFLLLGGLVILAVQGQDFAQLLRRAQPLHILATVLLICTFIPGLGTSVNGAKRWLGLGLITIQPGELVKYTVVFFAIRYFSFFHQYQPGQKIRGALQLLIPPLLLLLQPDFGSFTLCVAIVSFIVFLSDFPRKYFYLGLAAAAAGVTSLVFMAPYRVQRLLSYLDPWQDPKRSGFQIIQSFLAFANGHFWGKGIGNSNEKLFYLPEAHNDFIFSVIGEELGLFGVILIISLFIAFVFLGFKIAVNLPGKIAGVTVSTIIFAIAVQALLNMGVVLGLLPTKGLNLPFISYGGSSLVANCLAIGVLISAAKSGWGKPLPAPATDQFHCDLYRPYYRLETGK